MFNPERPKSYLKPQLPDADVITFELANHHASSNDLQFSLAFDAGSNMGALKGIANLQTQFVNKKQ